MMSLTMSFVMMIAFNVQLLLQTMKEDVPFWTVKLSLSVLKMYMCYAFLTFPFIFQAPEHNVASIKKNAFCSWGILLKW